MMRVSAKTGIGRKPGNEVPWYDNLKLLTHQSYEQI